MDGIRLKPNCIEQNITADELLNVALGDQN